jgi:endonuclease/exonuclease/phosphatase family metal-dependent hydrolase
LTQDDKRFLHNNKERKKKRSGLIYDRYFDNPLHALMDSPCQCYLSLLWSNRIETRSSNSITIATFNAENFYLLLDHDYTIDEFFRLTEEEYESMNNSIYNLNKERYKIQLIAQTIVAGDYDIICLCEVGGMETLENFNTYYLSSLYECYLYEMNSRRGIFVGALVKKKIFTTIVANNIQGKFSRNVLRLQLSRNGSCLQVYMVHLKSQNGLDRGIAQRIEEVRQLAGMVARTRCIVLGDFNGILVRGEQEFEFEPFLALPYRDVLESMAIPPGARFTHFYFGNKPNFSQLDYIFVSNDIQILDGGMVTDMVPINYEQRRRLPSDHIFLQAAIVLP